MQYYPFELFSAPDLIVGSVVILYMLYGVLVLTFLSLASKEFVYVKGTVFDFKETIVEHPDAFSSFKTFKLKYKYTIDGKMYQNNKIQFSSYVPGMFSDSRCIALGSFALGKSPEITIWVHPKYHWVSVLDKKTKVHQILVCLVFGLFWPILWGLSGGA
ncbi:Uncharacterised protein [BD1-7 clade bacterium]|nr:Uncharacterised protein [BD1-7 clade bacterium]